ncbi:ABC transporter permease [Aestuariibaculum lutulentum]|uniref:ABC transporter permease n=1 Tax=Aestuariibaculum lutulentum TaxID=2920935 RepID=A0ABS9RE82_9FLAO|nr:ABC transporter permease [Aestuariibaculum lutulentum]MCH4551250.1 ABC transporter permease [Aestuariibaculum lutulentum]
MAKQLAKRDITSQYRQSVLGFFWALFPAVMSALVWIVLQGTGTIKLSATEVPYPLFVFIGTTLWTVFSDCLNMPTSAVNGNKGLISKINFDKEALISLGFLKLSFNLLFKFLLIGFFMLYFKVTLSMSILLFIPLLIIIMLFFISVGVILVPLGVLYSDISRFVPIVMRLLMYVTPVLYAVPETGLISRVMYYNPLSYFMMDLRHGLTGFSIAYPLFWISLTGVTLFLVVIAMIIYRVSIPIITERMG